MKDLFNENQNPYHEAATPEGATLTRLALDERKINYKEVDHNNSGTKYKRFFVDPCDHDAIQLEGEIRKLQTRLREEEDEQIIAQYDGYFRHYSEYFNPNQKI